jgi:glutamine amidotransferase-like uncharacterized protein
VLVFTGTGTSAKDVAAIETILDGSRLTYATVSSLQLNGMSQSQLSRYRLLIVPGGNFVAMGGSLTARTTANVRNAVNGGLHYLGICAGAFLAGSFPAPYNSFDLSSGVKFGFYSAAKSGTRTAVLKISTAEGPAFDHYWEDGPELTGWGDVVGTYPDGTPAIVEGTVGRGWVILTGVHTEAPASWRRGMTFNTPASTDSAYARTLIVAALNRAALPHY